MKHTINDFEGPLDLLLHLIKTSKMSIYDVDIKNIINDYLEFINNVDKSNLDDISIYLVYASELIHLKSRLLVNKNITTDDETSVSLFTSEENLKEKLREYEKYKAISISMKEKELLRKELFTSAPYSLKEYKVNKVLEDNVSIEDLLDAFQQVNRRLNFNKPLSTRITKKELSVEDKIFEINIILEKNADVEFTELFTENTKAELVVTFLAILSMQKDNLLKIIQKDNFSEIILKKI